MTSNYSKTPNWKSSQALSQSHRPAFASPPPVEASPGHEPGGACEPTPQADATPWEMASVLAQRTQMACDIEHAISLQFEKRRTLAKRLQDAVRRKDGDMASESAKNWLRSEVALWRLFQEYAPLMQEREQLARGMAGD